ncbi:MAG: hypothetical protein V7644_2551 [Actinomycetota bacterium]|jgi:uncharacterized protein YkwD
MRKLPILLVFVCLLLAPSTPAGASLRPPESKLLQAVNAARTARGLRPLRLDSALTQAARAHSVDMLGHGYFAHGDFSGRMTAYHVRGSRMGEDLAWGNGPYARAAAVVQEWLGSPEHRANLLDPRFTRLGVGVASGSFHGSSGASVVTADFAG